MADGDNMDFGSLLQALLGAGGGGGFGMGLLSMGGGLLSGLMNQRFSAAQAQRQMDFQERMSNTSWQRGVADMTKAGINPILAASKGGASAPSGAMGSASVGNFVGEGVSSALQARQQQNLNEMNKETISKMHEEVENIVKTREHIGAQIDFTSAQAARASQEAKKVEKENDILKTAVELAHQDNDFAKSFLGQYVRTLGNVGRQLNPFTDSLPKIEIPR